MGQEEEDNKHIGEEEDEFCCFTSAGALNKSLAAM
jgi:hypothetical protein